MKALEEATNQSHHLGQRGSVTNNMQETSNSKHLHIVEKENDLASQTTRFATPEAVFSDSAHEKTSVYFSPSTQKSKKQRLAEKAEMSPKGVASPKVKTQMQINKEKAAKFRADLVAERRLSCGPDPVSFIQYEDTTHFNGISHQDTQKPSEPNSEVKLPIMTFASVSSIPSKAHVESPNMSSAIGYAQEPAVHQEPVIEGQKTRTKRRLTKKSISVAASDNLSVDIASMKDLRLDLVSIREGDSVGFEPEIPESRSGHNGWFPVNLDSLGTDNPAELNYQAGTEDFLVQPGIGKGDQNHSKKRKSRADIAQGTEGIEVETPKKKPRNIKPEPVDFPSPMIQ